MKRLAFFFYMFAVFLTTNSAVAIAIKNVSNLNFASFVLEHPNETEIDITNSTIILTPNIRTGTTSIRVNDGVAFYVTGINTLGDTKLLSNVDRNGMPIVNSGYVDSMYLSTSNWLSGDLYIHTVRQTNYSVVLGGAVGNYLDASRVKDPNDKLLVALDAATSRGELNRIMKNSVRLNPIQIMNNVGVVNSFIVADMGVGSATGFGVMPLYLYSKDFSVMGATAAFGISLSNNLYGTFGGHFARVNYSDAYDEWSGVLYGGNVGLLYQDSDAYVRASGVFSVADFDGPNVYDGTSNGTKPNGKTVLGTVDGGPVLSFMNGNMKFVPFIGFGVKYISIVDDSDTDFIGRMGANIEFKSKIDGNVYGYGARAFAQTDGDIYAGIFTNILSSADGFGGDLGFGVLYNDDIGVSYKISLNAKIEF